MTRCPPAETPGYAYSTGNIAPLLHEVRHALEQLLQGGRPYTIDLRGIPMGPGEEDRLMEKLGNGEVRANIHGLGRSELMETRYHGVWLVTHYNDEDEIVGRFIEITDCPWVMKSQNEDIRRSFESMTEDLQDGSPPAAPGIEPGRAAPSPRPENDA